MANDKDVLIDETSNESDNTDLVNEVSEKSDKSKLDARRKLEEYMEMKKLRELTDYY